MWVKITLLHFIIDSGSHKNLISVEVFKRLTLLKMSHLQPYTIEWIRQGSNIRVIQQCCLSYDIKPFKDEVFCYSPPLKFFNVLFGQPYLIKFHVVYESRPHSAIITLNKKLYRIPEAVPPSAISLISTKQCRKVISQKGKFVFFVIHSQKRKRSQPHPWYLQLTSPHSRSKWIRSWKHTWISSPHLLGYLCTVRSNTPSI
jgi:hypothetical protein